MEYPTVNQELCAGCAVCAEVCPAPDAIVIEYEKARIMEENCQSCRACTAVCPMAAIL